MGDCPMCHGLRGHFHLQEAMSEEFYKEYVNACREVSRLKDLFTEICWYEFERKSAHWHDPWPGVFPDTLIELCGTHIEQDVRNGRVREVGHFPVWYEGPISRAPPLPPMILLDEVKRAKEHMLACYEQVSAPHDWAPGGPKYNKLCDMTMVGR